MGFEQRPGAALAAPSPATWPRGSVMWWGLLEKVLWAANNRNRLWLGGLSSQAREGQGGHWDSLPPRFLP